MLLNVATQRQCVASRRAKTLRHPALASRHGSIRGTTTSSSSSSSSPLVRMRRERETNTPAGSATLLNESRRRRSVVKGGLLPPAKASSSSAEGSGDGGSSNKTLVLGGMFGLWYFFNIFFNIYNKQVLKVFRFPVSCTEFQFIVGGLLACFVWVTGLHKRPKGLTRSDLVTILPLACVHTLGNVLTNVSLGKVAVSFTHTIKAMEPFFSVVMSSIFLGDTPTFPIVASLFPIVGGVALASCTESSFNWAGFGAAMGSNLTFQSRNVLSKKFMGKTTLDNINLFSVITIMSSVLLLPFMLYLEGFNYTPAKISAMGLDPQFILSRALFAGVCFHMYQQVSYMILQKVSPVTHSIGNCVKRVVVIVSSVIVFQTPVSMLNAVGTAIALSGVFMYSQVKRLQTKNK